MKTYTVNIWVSEKWLEKPDKTILCESREKAWELIMSEEMTDFARVEIEENK